MPCKSELVFTPALMHLGREGGWWKGLAAARLCHAETCRSHLIERTYALGLAVLAREQRAVWAVEGSK